MTQESDEVIDMEPLTTSMTISTRFLKLVRRMQPLLEELLTGPTYQEETLRDLPMKGVYVFYENGEPVYVGRVGQNSKQTMRDRIGQHTRQSSGHNTATFAFKLLQEHLEVPIGHVKGRTREELAKKNDEAFKSQKKRVRNMTVRAVDVTDSKEQALFELYAIIALNTTRYNSFDTS